VKNETESGEGFIECGRIWVLETERAGREEPTSQRTMMKEGCRWKLLESG
jgi:hypothetical protein